MNNEREAELGETKRILDAAIAHINPPKQATSTRQKKIYSPSANPFDKNKSIITNALFNLRRTEKVLFSDVLSGTDELGESFTEALIAKEHKDGTYDVQSRNTRGSQVIVAEGIDLQETFGLFVKLKSSVDGKLLKHGISLTTGWGEAKTNKKPTFWQSIALRGIVRKGTHMDDHPDFKGREAYRLNHYRHSKF